MFSKITIIVRRWIVFICDRLLYLPALKIMKCLWNYVVTILLRYNTTFSAGKFGTNLI